MSTSGAPTQEGHAPVGVSLDEGCEDNWRAGARLLCGQAGKGGVVQHGEEKSSGRPYCSLSTYEGGL